MKRLVLSLVLICCSVFAFDKHFVMAQPSTSVSIPSVGVSSPSISTLNISEPTIPSVSVGSFSVRSVSIDGGMSISSDWSALPTYGGMTIVGENANRASLLAVRFDDIHLFNPDLKSGAKSIKEMAKQDLVRVGGLIR